MKKISALLIITFTVFLFTTGIAFAAVNKKINANIKTKRVPVGTVINLKLLDNASSSNNSTGDGFEFMVNENVKVNDDVVIPIGSVVRASADEVTAPGMLYKGGMIRFYFDHIVSLTGKQISFNAGICNNPSVTYDGGLSSKTNYGTAISKTAQTTKKIVVTPTVAAWEKGDDMLNGFPKYIFAPVTAIVAAPVAGIYFIGDSIADIFKKGEDITLNSGDVIQVRLTKPLDMPVY